MHVLAKLLAIAKLIVNGTRSVFGALIHYDGDDDDGGGRDNEKFKILLILFKIICRYINGFKQSLSRQHMSSLFTEFDYIFIVVSDNVNVIY